jgi:hypothetical protein
LIRFKSSKELLYIYVNYVWMRRQKFFLINILKKVH